MRKEERTRDDVDVLLRALHLPAFVAYRKDVVEKAEKGGWSFDQFLHHLAEMEVDERKRRKVERMLKQSGLPTGKTVAALDPGRLPAPVRRQLPVLCEGGFVERAENVLAFGLPGRGKTHLVCAVGQELVRRGYNVLFVPAYKLVQRLLVAKRDLALDKELRRLDAFDAVIVDDIGYIQQDRDEMEVLFTFLAQRYERRSVIITSNLVFSQWDKIFKDPMTTAAAIDRLVHHAVILEMTGPSVRSEEAMKRNGEQKDEG
jgi:DNA replication protein DnaC